MRFSHRDTAIAAALVAVTMAVYWPAMHGTLLWDDAGHITRPDLRSLGGLWRIWFEIGATQQYYPLLHSAFWLEHRFWGDHVLGYHLLNVLLHSTAAVLLRVLLLRLHLPGGWLAAWIFALHPMHVESVAWISEQKNTLSTVFYLGAGVVYLGFDRTRSLGSYGVATLLFLAAVSSKTTTVTLPTALLVVFWWSRGTLHLRRDVAPLAPWFAVALLAAATTAWFERAYIGAAGEDFNLGFIERALLAGRVVVFYASTFSWPVDLIFNYPRWEVDGSQWWQYLFLLPVVVVLVGSWCLRGRTRGPLASVLLFVGTLAPALGFINVYPFIYSYVADHFAYLANATLAAGASWLLVHGARRIGPVALRDPVPWVGAIVLLACGWTTWHQSGVYRDVETLYRTTIARNPMSWMAHENLGVLLTSVPGRLSEAAELFQAAARIRPDAQRRRNYALALADLPGREMEAIREFESLVGMAGAVSSDHVVLGRLLSRTPLRENEAEPHLWRAVELSPSDADARYALANALARRSDPRAEAQYRAAISLKPDFAEAHFNLGNLLARDPRRMADARSSYWRALTTRPEYAEAHYNLGTSLLGEPGRNLDAVAHLTAAVLLRPSDARMRTNLALALADRPGRAADAIRHLEAAVRMNPALRQPRELLAVMRGGATMGLAARVTAP
jgi:tetratricopeptide (TPR) repeat protein